MNFSFHDIAELFSVFPLSSSSTLGVEKEAWDYHSSWDYHSGFTLTLTKVTIVGPDLQSELDSCGLNCHIFEIYHLFKFSLQLKQNLPGKSTLTADTTFTLYFSSSITIIVSENDYVMRCHSYNR